jgi:hypothetical protein
LAELDLQNNHITHLPLVYQEESAWQSTHASTQIDITDYNLGSTTLEIYCANNYITQDPTDTSMMSYLTPTAPYRNKATIYDSENVLFKNGLDHQSSYALVDTDIITQYLHQYYALRNINIGNVNIDRKSVV